MIAPARREIIGTHVSMLDYALLIEMIDEAVARRQALTVCFAPASTLVMARRDPHLAAALASADVVAPDGMGVVKAARLLGESISKRVYGPDLMLLQCERAAAIGHRIWLQGGSDDLALADLRSELKRRFPGLLIAGGESPPHRPPTPDELDATVAAINASGADIVWVGLGSPKQELWMHELRERIEAPVLCGVGAAFDFHAGRVDQAPPGLRDHGFEWLYRLYKEPLRIGRRYLGTLPQFAALALAQALRERLGR